MFINIYFSMLQSTGGSVLPDMISDPLSIVTADGHW